MTEEELQRIEARASVPVPCLYCAGIGSTRGDDGEDRCTPCRGTGRLPSDPEALAMVVTLRRYREELEALRAAMGARYDR